MKSVYNAVISEQISEHKPRKGTETCFSAQWIQIQLDLGEAKCLQRRKLVFRLNGYKADNLDFRTQTPKGDGNHIIFLLKKVNTTILISEHKPRKGTETARVAASSYLSISYFRTQTPKGDGNLISATGLHSRYAHISEHKPRKGTETQQNLRFPLPNTCQFQNTNPERGRKLPAVLLTAWPDDIFQNTNPERGRKLNKTCDFLFRTLANFRTQTPKGDGNANIIANLSHVCHVISEHKPRKGTETSARAMSISSIREISEHKPRKGTETMVILFHVHKS